MVGEGEWFASKESAVGGEWGRVGAFMNEVSMGGREVCECFFGIFTPAPDDDGLFIFLESLPEDFPECGHPWFPEESVGVGFILADGKGLVD